MICSECFMDFGLRWVAKKVGEANGAICANCGSSSGAKLTKDKALEVMRVFFEEGSIDLRVGNRQPKYRVRDGEERHYESLALTPDLLSDCRLLSTVLKHTVDLNYARFTNLGIWGFLGKLREITLKRPSEKSYDELDQLLAETLSKFKKEKLEAGQVIYRVKPNLDQDINAENATLFDPSIPRGDSDELRDRFSGSVIPIFYGAFDTETCLFEVRPAYHEELTLGIFETTKELHLLNLEVVNPEVEDSHDREDLLSFVSRMLYRKDYQLTTYFGIMAYRLGFDGIMYCSYYSKVRRSRFLNVGLFGTPIKGGKLRPKGFNRIALQEAKYEYTLGPVFNENEERKMIGEILGKAKEEMESILPDDVQRKLGLSKYSVVDDLDINIHSLATVKRIHKR